MKKVLNCISFISYKRLIIFSISHWIRSLMSTHLCLGTYDDGKSFNMTQVTKWDMRRRLVYVCKFATNARPSRGNLRQVFNFLIGGKCIQQHLDNGKDEE